MRIATWNVNSIKTRLEHLLSWLADTKPDVVCLQEIKTVDANFPAERIEDAGYAVAVHGQKTYNGVALLARHPMEDVTVRLPGDETDEQARYIEALIAPKDAEPVRVASLYLPNGNPVPGPKYDYKLAWMERLANRTADLMCTEEGFVLAGDYNVIPHARDVHAPAAWAEDALFRPQTRHAYQALLNLGLTDAYRTCHGEGGQYSFWDYQGGAWPKNHGIRIDHLLLSPQTADRLEGAGIDRFTRGWEKPSDHVPVWCTLRD